jgi:hypothetical protein
MAMVEIDFLPLEYHVRHARQQVKPWRIVVVILAVLLLAVAAITQFVQRRATQSELDAAVAVCEGAARQNAEWATFQTKLQTLRSEAELFTYLRHPWPRSQLLSAVVAPLPREISIYQMQVAGEAPAEQPTADARPRADIKAEEEKLHKAPPAVRDGKRLHEEFDKERTFVRIAGVTTDAAALYRYLNVVSKDRLFSKVELRSIESVDTPQGPVMHFQAFLQVCPGYGQAGGPKGKVEIGKQPQVSMKSEARSPRPETDSNDRKYE